MDALKSLLVKKPFTRMLPVGGHWPKVSLNTDPVSVPKNDSAYSVYTQSDFMREYYPTGHRIYDKAYYPDRYKKDPESGRVYKEEVVRCAFAFQQMIALKHTITLCGNDIQFSLANDNSKKDDSQLLYTFLKGWETHDMEIAWYESARSAKITGDAAFVGYMRNGKFYWKVLSFLHGDTLYPHYDSATGDLSIFVRRYNDLDEDGNLTIRWAEVWDETYMYRFKEDCSGISGTFNKIKEKFGLDGFTMVSKEPHNFPFIPVSYIRTDGPCWQYSQDTIEQYELSFSYMAQNNLAFAFPIMYMKGDEIEISGEPMTDSIKVITMDNDSDAGFLNPPDGSSYFTMQLSKLYDMILEQSSIPKIPEPKSGDLPGVAVKLLFSPSIERAMEDAQLYKPFLNGMVEIFRTGYGTEIKQISSLTTMPLSFYIEPYVHMNNAELVSNLATAVQNGFLSKETASERIRMYASSQEFDRIIRELKEEQQHDILTDLQSKMTSETNVSTNGSE